MHGFSYIRQTALSNVAGRINYISNPEKQEYLYAVYETNSNPFWNELAKVNREQFSKFGTVGKCIEARELVIALPKSLQKYEPNYLLREFTNAFKEKYGVECSSALHHNKKRNNYHIHLIFSERKALENPVVKIATRNMYYNEFGKKVRTKKDVMQDGKLKAGCKIIKKGEVYEMHLFDKKIKFFKSKSFLNEIKHFYTDLINEFSLPNEKLKVFDKNSPYIATKKIGKNNPRAKEIKENNKAKDEWNKRITDAYYYGFSKEALFEIKQSEIIEPLKLNNNPEFFKKIVLRGARTVVNLIREFQRTPKDRRSFILENHLKEFVDSCRAPEVKYIKRDFER